MKQLNLSLIANTELWITVQRKISLNGLSIQRVDVLENIEKLEKQLFRQKRRLSRKEQNSNNSKETLEKIQKIENKLDNVYNDYMNKCISVVIKSNPTCVVIVENNQKFVTKIL